MAKREVLGTVSRKKSGETYTFRIERDKRMIYAVGNGDEEATTVSEHGAVNTVVINGLIGTLFGRGKVRPD